MTAEIGIIEAPARLLQPWPSAGTIGIERRGRLLGAKGIHVWDEAGRKLIDGPAGMWCVNAGHARHELADAMYQQAMSLPYNSPWYTSNLPAEELCARLVGHLPKGLDHVFLTTGGSSAVESALRFAQFRANVLGRPEKKKIVTRHRAYHGSTFLSGSLNARPHDRDWMDAADALVIRLACPDAYRRPAGLSAEAFRDGLVAEFAAAVAREGAETIAAFIAEPVMASGGVILPPEGYLRAIREICRANDILFVADEVVTAFGRLGHVFASGEVFGLDPDIVTFAKGVTSGYFPLGGMAVRGDLLADLRGSAHPKALFAHGLTYSSHPIGAAVALANLDILEGGLLAHARTVAPHFQAALAGLADLPLVGDVRGIGLMGCVECVTAPGSSQPLPADAEAGKRIDAHAQALGLLVRPLGNMCVMSPPLIITEAEIDRMVAILREAILRTQDDLRRDGLWQG
jgi:adenosylmethionine-8-amino-7-oxononanoate aminotransferase